MTLRRSFFAPKPGTFFAAALIAVFGFVLSTCENNVSLGGTVDVDSPKISVTEPSSGEFLKGTRTFRGIATDDKIVEYVHISFQGIVTGGGGSSNLSSTGYIPVQSYDAESGVWAFTLDTAAYTDGELTVQLKVSDSVNEIETPKLSYTIKNSPTTLELASPGPYTAADINRLGKSYEDNPGGGLAISLLKGLDFVATASDRQGVAPGYPRIKFWPVDAAVLPGGTSPDPAAWDAAKPADWSMFDDYGTSGWTEGNPIWAERKNPYVPSTFHLNERDAGYYRFQLLVRDVSGVEQYFPSADRAGWLRINIVSTPPEIEITSPAAELSYESDTLIFTALVRHEAGINDGSVMLKYNGPVNGEITVPASIESADPADPSSTTQRKVHYVVSLGSLPDGNYKFTFTAQNREGGEGSTFVNVIVDRTPPKPQINMVDREVSIYNESYYRAYFPGSTPPGGAYPINYVNGTITVHGNASDTYGIKTGWIQVGGNPPQEIEMVKWVIDPDQIGDPRALYDSFYSGAPNPGIPAANNQEYYSFTEEEFKNSRFFRGSQNIDTTSLAKGKHSFYLLAMDNAGNVGISGVKVLNVDQETDKPVIVFTDFNTGVENMQEENGPGYAKSILHPDNRASNLLGDSARLTGTIEDDDGLADGTIAFRVWRLDADNLPADLAAYVDNPSNLPVGNSMLNVAVSGNPASIPLQIDLG
ncbi:MAG: hypothetical protein LBC57_01680, partial [Treponema sp.]|nr:hypothetical protein [Treponema sp.]